MNRSPSISAPRIELDRLDEPGLRVRRDLDDLAFDALDAEALAELAQEFRVQARVDVEGVVHAAARQVREAILLRRLELEAIVAVVAGEIALAALQPEVLEAGGPVILAGDAEGMNVVLRRRRASSRSRCRA